MGSSTSSTLPESSKSSRTTARGYAGWTKSSCECYHFDSIKIKKVRWIKVKMTNTFLYGAAEVGRGAAAVLTLGYTTREEGGIKDLTHECIEVYFDCRYCNAQRIHTFEYGDDGKAQWAGFYKTNTCVKSFNPSQLTLGDVRSIFGKMWNDGYKLLDRNCGDWSRRFYMLAFDRD